MFFDLYMYWIILSSKYHTLACSCTAPPYNFVNIWILYSLERHVSIRNVTLNGFCQVLVFALVKKYKI